MVGNTLYKKIYSMMTDFMKVILWVSKYAILRLLDLCSICNWIIVESQGVM